MKIGQEIKSKGKLKDKETAIIKAAKGLFAEKGFQGSSIRDIAKIAGIATGTFYLYFKNKEVFFKALIEETYYELLNHIKKERKKADDTLKKLELSMEACVHLFVKERNLAKIMLIQAPNASPFINTQLSELQNNLVQLIYDDLEELMELNLIPKQNIKVASLGLVGGFYAIITRWLREEEPFDLYEATKSFFLYSIHGLLGK